jgi:hypothetical protein
VSAGLPRLRGSTLARWVMRGWIVLIVAVAVLACAAVVLGAEPSATALAVLEGGDPRSDTAAPGLVGSPVLVLAGVIALGLATALVTAVLARLTRRD